MSRMDKRWIGLLPLLAAACSQAPAYHPPVAPLPAKFADADKVWGEAQPAAPSTDKAWWRALGDPALDAMEDRLEKDNPSLAAILAKHRLAMAALRQSKAATMPDVESGGVLTRNRQSDNRPLRSATQPAYYEADSVGATVSYELDLWGRVRDSVKAARANAQASAEDVAALRLALQADLASTWTAMRGADLEIAILSDAVGAYQRADDVTHHRYDGGIATGIDVGRADAQLADAQAQLAQVRVQRAVLAHAVATLAGIPAGEAQIAPLSGSLGVLSVPASLPATLLQRRPDIAAAERRMYAANRAIGVARAARFPQISLGGNGGFQSMAVSSLISAPNAFWALGPQFSLPIFDGGRIKARIEAARADWDAAAANYRGNVLQAMREVEDGLTSMDQLQQESAAQNRAADAAGKAAKLSYELYIKGANTLLDVVTAETAELAARRRAAQVATQRVQTSIALVRALGGAA